MRVITDIAAYVRKCAEGQNVLYVGAGNEHGDLAEGARLVQQCARTWCGLDLDPAVAKRHPDLRIFTVNLNDDFTLDLPEIDLVIMTEVLEHLEAPARTLRLLGRATRGARFLGSVPSGMSIGRMVLSLIRPRLYATQDGGHLALYSRATLTNMLKAGSLRNIRLQPYVTRPSMRFFATLHPDLASGWIIEGQFPPA